MSEILETQILSLPQGLIKGAKRQTIYDDLYYSFEGIPFAKPPLGELRFRAPQPAEPWTGIKDCTQYANKPMQRNLLTQQIEGDEDCLYLNVYTKQLQSEKLLPVMVYSYGGAFCRGEASRRFYSPDYFMAKNVVLVNFNYRLCSLGFLNLKDPTLQVPGNAALKDQVLALKWIKKYISYFNGDPDNITVFGNSSGSISVHYMLATEQTRGLFHKAILMSGTLHNSVAITATADYGYRLAKLRGYQGENVDKQVLDYLRTLDASKLVSHNFRNNNDRQNGLLFTFGPTVESYVTEDCVIPKPPLEMVRDAWGNNLPIMIGGTSLEGLFLYRSLKAFPEDMNTFIDSPTYILPYEVSIRHNDEENKAFSESLIKLHFGDEKPSPATLMQFLDYYSYKFFWHGFYRTILSRLQYSTASTYFYRFDFDSPEFNFHRIKFCGNDLKEGVSHSDELGYLFYGEMARKLDKSSAEYRTIQVMIGMWSAFAEKSDPNCSEIEPTHWTPLDPLKPNIVLNINKKVDLINLPELEKLKVWNSLYASDELF